MTKNWVRVDTNQTERVLVDGVQAHVYRQSVLCCVQVTNIASGPFRQRIARNLGRARVHTLATLKYNGPRIPGSDRWPRSAYRPRLPTVTAGPAYRLQASLPSGPASLL